MVPVGATAAVVLPTAVRPKGKPGRKPTPVNPVRLHRGTFILNFGSDGPVHGPREITETLEVIPPRRWSS